MKALIFIIVALSLAAWADDQPDSDLCKMPLKVVDIVKAEANSNKMLGVLPKYRARVVDGNINYNQSGVSLLDKRVGAVNGETVDFYYMNSSDPMLNARNNLSAAEQKPDAAFMRAIIDTDNPNGGINCDVDNYEPGQKKVKSGDIMCVRSKDHDNPTYGVLRVEAICQATKSLVVSWTHHPRKGPAYFPPGDDPATEESPSRSDSQPQELPAPPRAQQ
jgi:hypothetical protein